MLQYGFWMQFPGPDLQLSSTELAWNQLHVFFYRICHHCIMQSIADEFEFVF